MRVDDFDATLDRITGAGCEVIRPARREAYGQVSVFRDPWGNLWDLLSS
nr:VOC family protein [Nocardioides thalensis]